MGVLGSVGRGVLAVVIATSFVASARADGGEEPGVGRSGLAGIDRVGIPSACAPRLTFAGTAGYGYTEEIEDEGGGHHRAFGALALGSRPVRWLSLALRVDGRYDAHPADMLGDDDGWVGEPGLVVRAGGPVVEGLRLGGEVGLAVPGADAPSFEAGALRLDAAVLAAYTVAGSGLTIATDLGYRHDRSSDSVEQPENLRRGDRIALGVSDFDAVLVGFGLLYRIAATELLAEASWELLIGDGAPAVTESPLRVTGGVRQHLSSRLSLELLLEGSPGRRPEVGRSAPLAPIEPRVSAMLGVRYVLPLHRQREPASDEVETEAADAGHEPEPEAPRRDPPDGPRGLVVDADGAPVAGAEVKLLAEDEVVATTRTDGEGRYAFASAPEGPARLVVAADGFEELTVELGEGDSPPESLALQPATPIGELRGLVRSFRGEPLSATIHISPGDVEVETGEDGRFDKELEVGEYEVQIRASGYRDQTRRVEVEENGVTVLNADLRRAR